MLVYQSVMFDTCNKTVFAIVKRLVNLNRDMPIKP